MTRTIVVTGASSGIGRELARIAAAAGWDVVATGRRAHRLAELREATADAPGTLHALPLELLAPGAAKTLVAFALERTGRIDVVANVAGAGSAGDVLAQSDEALAAQFGLHAVVPAAIVREARAALTKTKGLVFFVGSGVARVPVGGFGAYCAAKAAIRSLSRTIRLELRGDGVAVTYVDPGVIKTEFHQRLGYAGPPASLTISAEFAARRIFEAIPRRTRELNVVAFQWFALAAGQLAPAAVDELLLLLPERLGIAPLPARPPEAAPPAQPPEPQAEQRDGLAAALAPLENRMKRNRLSLEFIREALGANEFLDLNEVALSWAGMPNKNERTITRDVLEALADAGFLVRSDSDRYSVVRAATPP